LNRLWVAGLALALAACAQGPAPRDHYYRMIVGAAERLPAPLLNGTLIVQPMEVDGLLRERAIVYSREQAPTELNAYRYRLWADPPARMLDDLTIDFLRAAGLADKVVGARFRGLGDWSLSGRLERLEQIRGARSRVVVRVEFGLTRSADDKLILVRDYLRSADAADPGVSAAVAAMSKALGAIYAQLVADLNKR